MSLAIVDFPDPLCPMKETDWPFLISTLTEWILSLFSSYPKERFSR